MNLRPTGGELRLGLAGVVPGNDHPYSWTALINGYEPLRLADAADPIIAEYLEEADARTGLNGARVTHIWAEDQAVAKKVAGVSAPEIPKVVDAPQALIGQVDAVLIPTDIGTEHVARARPFVEAGIPVLVDKPLTDEIAGLRQFEQWHREGAAIMSCSALRFAPELAELRRALAAEGGQQVITVSTVGSWNAYGIHALEAVYSTAPPGRWVSVQNVVGGAEETFVVRHRDGVDVIVTVHATRSAALGGVIGLTAKGARAATFSSRYESLRAQLSHFIDFVRNGVSLIDFAETLELAAIVVAGCESRERGGVVVPVPTIDAR